MGRRPRIRVFFRSRYMVQNDCRLWARSIAEDWEPDLVVFLAKSGFLFAEAIASELGCPMAEAVASRPDNGAKDAIRERVPWVPRWALALALTARSGFERHERDGRRDVRAGRGLEAAGARRVLVVDDSVDTGWSMLGAVGLVRSLHPEVEVRVASYCAIAGSESRIRCDYVRFRDAIVMTATSRFSPEHGRFLEGLAAWEAAS